MALLLTSLAWGAPPPSEGPADGFADHRRLRRQRHQGGQLLPGQGPPQRGVRCDHPHRHRGRAGVRAPEADDGVQRDQLPRGDRRGHGGRLHRARRDGLARAQHGPHPDAHRHAQTGPQPDRRRGEGQGGRGAARRAEPRRAQARRAHPRIPPGLEDRSSDDRRRRPDHQHRQRDLLRQQQRRRLHPAGRRRRWPHHLGDLRLPLVLQLPVVQVR